MIKIIYKVGNKTVITSCKCPEKFAIENNLSEFTIVDDDYNLPADIDDLKLRLSYIRKNKASQGVLVDGVSIQTDDRSRSEMSHYVLETVINGLVNVNWKKADGTFEVYTVQDFKPVYKAIVKYVDDCFIREMELIEEIDNALDPSLVDLESGWPPTSLTTR